MAQIGAVEGILRLRDEFSGVLTRAASQLEQSAAKIKKLGSDLSDVGGRLTQSVTLPIIAIGGAAVKLASDFESSFAGVRKTVDATEEQFADIAQSFRNMAKEIPVGVNELNNVAEAAGQLGIKVADIEAFTRVMVDLARTTNLTSDEAATSIAQFQNIFGAAGKEVDRFGSTLVALGNAGASTEKSILEMGVRIAGAGNQIGLTQGEVLAFASALSSLGIEAEAGGSAISKVMINMALAVSRGGEELASFAEVAGVTSQQFAAAFRDDASAAVQSFIVGLNKIQQSGGDVLTVLDQMEITEVRMRDALLRAAGAGDLLTDALNLQSRAWQENSALTIEAQKRYATFESQLTVFMNNLKDAGITLGQALLPVLRDLLTDLQPLIKRIAELANWFANLPKSVRLTIVAIAGIAAAIGPVLFVAGNLITSLGTIISIAPRVAAAVKIMMGPWGLLAAAIAGATLALSHYIDKWKERSQLGIDQILRESDRVKALHDALSALRDESNKGIVSQELFDKLGQSMKAVTSDIEAVKKQISDLTNLDVKGTVEDWEPSAKTDTRLKAMVDRWKSLNGELSSLTKVWFQVRVEAEKTGQVIVSNPPTNATVTGIRLTKEELEQLRNEFESLIDSTSTTQEKAAKAIKRLKELMASGVGSADQFRLAYNRLLIEMVNGSQELEKVKIGAPVVDVEGIAEAIRKAFNIDPSIYKPSLEKFRQAVKETLHNLDTDLDFAIELSGIDQADDHLRRVEESYLGLLQRTGAASVDEAERALEYIATTLGTTIDEIKAKLGQLDDIRIASRYKDIGKTAFTIYKEERAQILRLMKETNGKILITAEDGAEALRRLERERWDSALSAASQALHYLADQFGGFFDYLSQAVDALGRARAFGQSVGQAASAFTDNASTIATASSVGTVVAIFAEVYSFVDKMIQKHNQMKYGTSASYAEGSLGGGSYFDELGQQIFRSMRDLVRSIEDTLNISIDDLQAIGIKVRNDGNRVMAYVRGELVGVFSSIDEAIGQALIVALQDPSTSIRGMSQLMREALEGFVSPDLDELRRVLESIQEISNIGVSDSIIQLRAELHHLDELWETLTTRLHNATPAVTDALNALSTQIVQSIQSAYDRLYGTVLSPAEQRQRLEQEGRLLDAEKHLRIAEIQARIIELQAMNQIHRYRRDLIEGGIDLEQQEIDARRAALQAKGTLAQAELTIAQAQINALREVLAALMAIPDIDISRIVLPGAGGRGGGRRQQAEDFTDQLNDIIGSGASDLSRSLGDLRDRMRELSETQARLGIDTVLFKEAMEELRRQLRAQVRDLVDAALGGGSEWEQRAQEIRDRWQEVTDAVREHLEETGERLVPFWQINAAMAAELRDLAEDAIGSLGLPLEQIRSQFAQLADTLSFLQQMVAAGIITADRYGEIIGQIGDQMVSSIGHEILNFIEQWGVEIKDIEELRRKLTKMDIDMQILGWKTQIALAASLNLITAAQQEEFAAIIAEIESQLPDILDSIGESVDDIADAADNLSQSIQDMYQDQQQQLQQEIQRAMDLLNRYREDGLSPFQRDLNRIEEDFALIRARLGNTIEVQELYAAALQRLHDQYLDTIRDFQQSFIFSDQSPLTLNQQFNEAMSQFQDVLGQVSSGDLSLAGSLPNLAQQLFTLYAQMVPTGSEAYRDFFDLIMAQLTDISGVIVPPTATTPPVSNVIPFPGNPSAQFNDTLTSAITSSSSNEVVELIRVRNATNRVADGIEDLIDKVGTKPNTLRKVV